MMRLTCPPLFIATFSPPLLWIFPPIGMYNVIRMFDWRRGIGFYADLVLFFSSLARSKISDIRVMGRGQGMGKAVLPPPLF